MKSLFLLVFSQLCSLASVQERLGTLFQSPRVAGAGRSSQQPVPAPARAKARSPGAGDTGTRPAAFERCPERDTPHPLEGFQGSASLHGKQLFLLREQGRADEGK